MSVLQAKRGARFSGSVVFFKRSSSHFRVPRYYLASGRIVDRIGRINKIGMDQKLRSVPECAFYFVLPASRIV
jgi:hypothetical protein